MRSNDFFGLPNFSKNAISIGIAVFLMFLGARIYRSTDTDLKVANVQLTTSSSAAKLERLAQQLEVQAEIIKRKEAAYQELQATYNEYINRRKDGTELKQKIRETETLPKVQNTEKIQTQIQETKEKLLEVTEE